MALQPAKIDVTATSFNVSQSGASNFKGDVSAAKTDFDINGASATDVDGTTTDLTVSASGASNFKGGDLQAVNCKIEATGASSANINVSKILMQLPAVPAVFIIAAMHLYPILM